MVRIPFGPRVVQLASAQGWSVEFLRQKVNNVTSDRFRRVIGGLDFPTAQEAEEFARALDVSLTVIEGDGKDLECQNREALIALLKRRAELHRFVEGWRKVRAATLASSHHNAQPFDDVTLLELINGRRVARVGTSSKCWRCGNATVGDDGRCRACRSFQDVD